MRAPTEPLVYDSGALVAAERGNNRFAAFHRRYVSNYVSPIIPSPVLTQVWRGSARQTLLHRVIHSCSFEPVDRETAKRAGVLLGKAHTSDAVDAIVVAIAVGLGVASVLTSDPDAIQLLVNASEAKATITVIPI